MCLAVKYDKKRRNGVGYKILAKGSEGNLQTGFCDARTVILTEGKWVVDPKIGDIDAEVTYPSGFHIFTKRRDAERIKGDFTKSFGNAVIRKVQFRKVVACGEVGWEHCQRTETVVAKECMLLKEEV